MGFSTPEQGDKFKKPVAHTHLIKVDSPSPPPPGLLGMLIDSIRLEAGLQRDKIKHIREALCRWECRKSCTLTELQSLIDTLHFACKVVPPDRPFLQRMIALTKDLVKPHYHIRLNNGFREDLRMWKQLIDNWNDTNMFMDMNEA